MTKTRSNEVIRVMKPVGFLSDPIERKIMRGWGDQRLRPLGRITWSSKEGSTTSPKRDDDQSSVVSNCFDLFRIFEEEVLGFSGGGRHGDRRDRPDRRSGGRRG